MRYFLISFFAGGMAGNLHFGTKSFPSHAKIKKDLTRLTKDQNPVIINIFEFKTEQDYNDFSTEIILPKLEISKP
jgi:hypothetical protein